ncbi:MAG: hypothetical protein LQ338_006357 [Usnochroma carphineum]|nr:MAG: hypothetical protein LQ338_006357 [Usnochroma carphineum]
MDEQQYPKGIKLVIIMTSLLLGTSLMALDATIISVATPKITTQFGALGDVGWYGAAYSMLLTATTPIAANFYKNFNPKYVYLAFILTIYYMPFYFQAALDNTALRSGINYMSLAVPQMIGLFVGGGITTATGHYMPVILFAQILCGVGAGLLTTLRTSTSTATWATFMALTGLGIGLGVNVPHIAIQAVMKTDYDIFIANGIASFFGQLGGSLGVPIGNAVLIAALHSYVPRLAPGVSADAVVDAGALNMPSLTTSTSMLQGLREAWALAVSRVNILLLVVICVSVPTACGMKWLNIKKISREREEEKRINDEGKTMTESGAGDEARSLRNRGEKATDTAPA